MAHHVDGKPANRLIHEKSPYLLQHAYNPVDWHAWDDQAFAKARRDDKPIFLSIGYSTCHWCHVMERESFEDRQVADLLNRVFVCIKVDREERPDLDHIYMSVCQAITGSGGWPLTILLSPDKRPFFAGTYFPKNTVFGRIGVMELAEHVDNLWRTARRDINKTAESILRSVQAMNTAAPGELPGEDLLHIAYGQLEQRFDENYGGFGSAPKFPTAHNLFFLLRYWKRTGEVKALAMVEKTIRSMSSGGIYDHIGFGFHRYSTDKHWLLPHFEKMLYDQALLAIACLETYQATGKNIYASLAGEIFTYVLRDMTSSLGGFYSAEDADSEGKEGKFYLWTVEETKAVLGEEDAALFNKLYNVKPAGNFHDEATGALTGTNIPHLTEKTAELAGRLGLSDERLAEKLDNLRHSLYIAREKRIHPSKDDKVLTDWNGLMIAALAIGGRVLSNERYIASAKKAVEFIFSRLKSGGRLIKRYRDGEASLPAHLDDYSFFIWGLLELYETTFDAAYLSEALALNQVAYDRFWDQESGSFYFTADDAEELPLRHRELYDGAIPSGNSVAAMNSLRLARLTGNGQLEERAGSIARAFSREIRRAAQAYTQMLCTVDFMIGPPLEIVIAGNLKAKDTQYMLKTLYSAFVPNKIVLLHPSGEESRNIGEIAPHIGKRHSIQGKATAYVCRNFSCQAPVTDTGELMKLLGQ